MQTNEKVNVLIVDDDPKGLLAAQALESLEVNLLTARSGEEALKLVCSTSSP